MDIASKTYETIPYFGTVVDYKKAKSIKRESCYSNAIIFLYFDCFSFYGVWYVRRGYGWIQ